MSDGTIGNVKRMVSDSHAPTAPLDEFITAYEDDDNWWWQIACGHHMNLFDAALERIQEQSGEIDRLRQELSRQEMAEAGS